MQASGSNTASRLEKSLAIAGMAVCLVVTLAFWSSIATYQTMWPLPGSYFVELMFLSVVDAVLWVRGDPCRAALNWAVAGIFCAFAILGAISVGFFYIPNILIFGLLGIFADLRTKHKMWAHLGIFLVAVVAQAVLMFAAIHLLYPSAIF
jgi:hypothetical protein